MRPASDCAFFPFPSPLSGFPCLPFPVFQCKRFFVNQRLIAEIGKSQRLRIVNRLKRTQGMSVGELSELLGMSYMGVKQHCIELEQRGYLDTFRRPNPKHRIGRPEMLYRLTRKAHELFPTASNEMTLELLASAQALYGPAAPEKLLFFSFQRKAEFYLARVKGEGLVERAKSFAGRRDSEGYMSELENENEKGERKGLRIVEHHSPIADLLQAYPALLNRLEEELFSRVLKVPVKREQTVASGLYSCVFRLDAGQN